MTIERKACEANDVHLFIRLSADKVTRQVSMTRQAFCTGTYFVFALTVLTLAEVQGRAQDYDAQNPDRQRFIHSAQTVPASRSRSVPQASSPRMPVQFRNVSQPGVATDIRTAPSPSSTRSSPDRSTSKAGNEESKATEAPLPITRPRARTEGTSKAESAGGGASRPFATWTVICFITAGACAIVWLTRRGNSASRGQLPGEAFSLLGRAQVSPRLEVHLIRVGNKLVLVGTTTQSHQTLCEITDRDEVERIITACGDESGSSIAANMRRALAQLDRSTGSTSESRPRRATREIADA